MTDFTPDLDTPEDPLERKLSFGKYRGATYQQLIDRSYDDKTILGYIDWLVNDAIGVPEETRLCLEEWLIEERSYDR